MKNLQQQSLLLHPSLSLPKVVILLALTYTSVNILGFKKILLLRHIQIYIYYNPMASYAEAWYMHNHFSGKYWISYKQIYMMRSILGMNIFRSVHMVKQNFKRRKICLLWMAMQHREKSVICKCVASVCEVQTTLGRDSGAPTRALT